MTALVVLPMAKSGAARSAAVREAVFDSRARGD